MTELLLFKKSHAAESVPRPSTRDLAALPKRFDLVTVQADGWPWGVQELTNPIFRIVALPLLQMPDAEQFLTPLLPERDVNLQRRLMSNIADFSLISATRPCL